MNHLAANVVDVQGRRGVAIFKSSCVFCVALTIRIEGRNLVRTGERENREGEAELALVEIGWRCLKSSPRGFASLGLTRVQVFQSTS